MQAKFIQTIQTYNKQLIYINSSDIKLCRQRRTSDHKESNKLSQLVQPREDKNLIFMKFHKIPSTPLTTPNSKSRRKYLFSVYHLKSSNRQSFLT